MKKNKRLVIVDLLKSNNRLIENCDFIALNYGTIRHKNTISLDIKSYYEKFLILGKKKYLETLKKYLTKKKIYSINPVELEISNCRNEKYDYIHKIINIVILKEIIKDYQQVEIICDDPLYYNSYKSLSKKIEIDFKGKKRNFSYVLSFLISRFYFFIRTLLFISYIKLFTEKKQESLCGEVNLTFYPLFYKDDQDYMYGNGKKNLNFLITDETHLHSSLSKLYKNFLKINNDKKIIIVEKYIQIKDVIQNLFLTFKLVRNLKFNNSFRINNIKFDDIILTYFYKSLINRSKLSIYTKALPKIAYIYEIKKVNYIMFEYGFGYFLKNSLPKKIFFTGYQHGYYSDKIMWLDQVCSYKNKNEFLPNLIISKNKWSFNSYKKKFSSNIIKIDKENKIINNFFNEINNSLKNSNKSKNKKDKLLIICGAYDFNEIVNSVKVISIRPDFKNTLFYLKIHPKMILNIDLQGFTNIKIIKKLGNNKFKKTIITSASTMTTEAENYLNSYSIIGLPFKHDVVPSNFPLKKIYNIY